MTPILQPVDQAWFSWMKREHVLLWRDWYESVLFTLILAGKESMDGKVGVELQQSKFINQSLTFLATLINIFKQNQVPAK